MLIYQKMKLQSKNYEILHKQKLRKNTHAEMSYERTRKNSFCIVIILLARKRFLKRMAYTALKQFE